MTAQFDQCKNKVALNLALHRYVFNSLDSSKDLDLASEWGMETNDGNEYVRKHGLDIVTRALRHYLECNVDTCVFAKGDIGKANAVGVPFGNDLQNSMLDDFVENPDIVGICYGVNNNVLSRKCYRFVFAPENNTVDDNSPASPVSLDETAKQKPSSKRRRTVDK